MTTADVVQTTYHDESTIDSRDSQLRWNEFGGRSTSWPNVLILTPPSQSAPGVTSVRWAHELVLADSWVSRLSGAVLKFGNLAKGWDLRDAGPPSQLSIKIATEVLETLWKWQVKPHRVAPSADGGIIFLFFRGPFSTSIEIDEEGQVSLTAAGPEGLLDDREIDQGADIGEALLESLSLAAYRSTLADVSMEASGDHSLSA